jgi:TRAP-type C4-dicarboxylate transport system permease small subunit
VNALIRHRLAAVNARIECALGALLSALTVAMVLTVLWQVATRLYARLATAQGWSLRLQPSQWTEELASFLLAWVALLGAAYALRRGEHMGYDSLFVAFGERGKQRCTVFIKASVVAFAVVLVFGGIGLVWMTLELGQTTPALRWPMGLIYCAAPISGALMILFAIERVFVDEDPALVPPHASENDP